jgi:hypothetical protein
MVVNNKKVKREKKSKTGIEETKDSSTEVRTTGNLFNNSMVESAMKALSPEDLQRYKEIGEKMYGTVNFEDSQIINNFPPPMYEAGAYISEQLKSGLHPSMMDDDEKRLMEELFGKEWYTKWGYVEADLTDIVTVVYSSTE